MARQLLQLFPILSAALFISSTCAEARSRFELCPSSNSGNLCESGDLTTCSCVPLNSSICQNYSHAVVPNYRGYRDLEDTEIEIKSFQQLIDTQCSKYLTTFLCLYYYPYCDCGSGYYSPVPCRDFCLAVRKECKAKVKQLKWPRYLACRKRFPKDNCFDPRVAA